MTSDSGALSPEEVSNATFETKRRGYDPAAVNAHLKSAASTVTTLETQVVDLAAKVDALTLEVESAHRTAEIASQDPIELDEDTLAERIGHDAARVLSEARAAAADRLAEAEAEAEAILARAEEVHAVRSREADEEAARIRAQAGVDADQRAEVATATAAEIVLRAEADVEAVRSEVFSDRETADAEGVRIIREAELTRRQILEDLARRRSAARRQIEQLRAGRERLLASHETVRRALDEISEELTISMSEARAAAETAGHTVSDTTIEELEAEIETARLSGLLDTGPVPVVRSPALPTSSSANIKKPLEPKAPKVVEATATDAKVDADSDERADDDVSEKALSEKAVDEKAVDEKVVGENEVAKIEPATSQGAASAGGDSTDDGDGALAQVVQLDKARAEVDTGSHPAKGRDAGNGRQNKGSSAVEASDDVKPVSAPTTAGLAAAPDPADDSADALDDSVGDLFASLRTEKEPDSADEKSSEKKPSAKKKPAKSKPAKKKAASTPAVPVEPEVDSSGLARRLKRVLADEQSRAMSTLKSAEETPDLDGILKPEAEHRATYWNEVLDQVDDADSVGPEASVAILELVATIRRRVGDALDSADGDHEAAVVSLRSIYREIKTQLIGSTADTVCRSF